MDILCAVTIAGRGSEGVGDHFPKLLSEEVRDCIFEEVFKGMDLVPSVNVKFGGGFALRGADGG